MEDNKTSSDISDNKSTQFSRYDNVIIRFLLLCIAVNIISFSISYLRYGTEFQNLVYPLNLLFYSSPFVLINQLFDFIGIPQFFIIPSHWMVFNFSEAVRYFGFTKIIVGIILTPIGLGLNYFIATQMNIKQSDKSDEPISDLTDDVLYDPILSIKEIINNSRKVGFNHASTIIGSYILWILTIWVPYINVGTTIGLLGMVPKLATNEKFSPFDIFKKKYRKNMGEFFLLVALMSVGISVGFLFLGFPGIVISIAWSQALFLHVDRGFSPLKSINVSNDITYGEKSTMFFSFLLLTLFYGFIYGLALGFLTALDLYGFIAIFALVGQLFISLIIVGYYIYVYSIINKKLSD